jgi:hypothetical protein
MRKSEKHKKEIDAHLLYEIMRLFKFRKITN